MVATAGVQNLVVTGPTITTGFRSKCPSPKILAFMQAQEGRKTKGRYTHLGIPFVTPKSSCGEKPLFKRQKRFLKDTLTSCFFSTILIWMILVLFAHWFGMDFQASSNAGMKSMEKSGLKDDRIAKTVERFQDGNKLRLGVGSTCWNFEHRATTLPLLERRKTLGLLGFLGSRIDPANVERMQAGLFPGSTLNRAGVRTCKFSSLSKMSLDTT